MEHANRRRLWGSYHSRTEGGNLNRRDWGWECVKLDRVGGLEMVEVDGLVLRRFQYLG